MARPGRNGIPAGSVADLVKKFCFLAAPTGDDVGLAADDFLGSHRAGPARANRCAVRRRCPRHRRLDEFAHPADAADERIVPLLEINSGLCGQTRAGGAGGGRRISCAHSGGRLFGRGLVRTRMRPRSRMVTQKISFKAERWLVAGYGVAAPEPLFGGLGLHHRKK